MWLLAPSTGVFKVHGRWWLCANCFQSQCPWLARITALALLQSLCHVQGSDERTLPFLFCILFHDEFDVLSLWFVLSKSFFSPHPRFCPSIFLCQTSHSVSFVLSASAGEILSELMRACAARVIPQSQSHPPFSPSGRLCHAGKNVCQECYTMNTSAKTNYVHTLSQKGCPKKVCQG
jgi:hypothetical protein